MKTGPELTEAVAKYLRLLTKHQIPTPIMFVFTIHAEFFHTELCGVPCGCVGYLNGDHEINPVFNDVGEALHKALRIWDSAITDSGDY